MNKFRRIATGIVAGAALALTATGLAYAANPEPGNTAPIAQKRLVDVPGKSIANGQTQTLVAVGHADVPANATGVTGFITILHGPNAEGILTVWDGVSGAPGTPTVRGKASAESSGTFHVALNNGTLKVYSRGATVSYIITITGYDVPDTHHAAPTAFGAGQVFINTKFGNTKWAGFSTPLLGAPEGDQASGVFRFTCTLADGCDLTLKAYSTADGWTIYPRILLTREDNTTGAKFTCEYADGINNDNGAGALTGTSSDTATVVTLGIGSTADCGGNQTGTQPNGVDHINVPGAAGQGYHYDAEVTLTFVKTAA